MPTAFWRQVDEPTLAQGDLLPKCLVPEFAPEFGTQLAEQVEDIPVGEADLIIVTQSCDLENAKVNLVALCPIYSLAEFEANNPAFTKKGR